jgi:hypothetical protein
MVSREYLENLVGVQGDCMGLDWHEPQQIIKILLTKWEY